MIKFIKLAWKHANKFWFIAIIAFANIAFEELMEGNGKAGWFALIIYTMIVYAILSDIRTGELLEDVRKQDDEIRAMHRNAQMTARFYRGKK